MGCIISNMASANQNEKKYSLDELKNCNWSNTKKFTFADKVFTAKVIKVYDGDTITVALYVFGDYHKFSVRMDGYDTPEIKPKKGTPEEKAEEKKWGVRARDFLADMVMNKIVTLNCKDYDKYGRILGEVLLDGKNINYIMIKDGYSRLYDGGHKDTWDFTTFEKKWKRDQKLKQKESELENENEKENLL